MAALMTGSFWSGHLDPFRRRQALLYGFVIGVGSGGADHAHPSTHQRGRIAGGALRPCRGRGSSGFGMDHVDGDMDVGMRLIEVLDDNDLPLLGLQDFDCFERGFEHAAWAGWSSGCQFGGAIGPGC